MRVLVKKFKQSSGISLRNQLMFFETFKTEKKYNVRRSKRTDSYRMLNSVQTG